MGKKSCVHRVLIWKNSCTRVRIFVALGKLAALGGRNRPNFWKYEDKLKIKHSEMVQEFKDYLRARYRKAKTPT